MIMRIVRSFCTRLLLLACLVGLTACSTVMLCSSDQAKFESAIAQAGFVIVPSEYRFGPIRMGMTANEVRQILGCPEKSGGYVDAPGFRYFYDNGDFHIGFNGNEQVFELEVWDPRFVTDTGIRIGSSTSEDVERAYGNPSESISDMILYKYSQVTLRFVVKSKDRSYRVFRIALYVY